MEKKQKSKKNLFLKKVKTAIFKLEDYGDFLQESPSAAFKYLFLLILFTALIMATAMTYNFSKIINKGFNYFKNEVPDFSLKNDELKFDDYIEGYDEEYNFRLIIDTFDIENEKISEYTEKIKSTGSGILLLKDKLIIFTEKQKALEDNYSNIISNYNLGSVENKEDIIKLYTSSSKISMFCMSLIIITFALYLSNAISILIDLCMIAIIGMCIAKISGINLKLIGAIELSIYSLTLSIILSAIYTSANIIIPAFRIEHFDIIYLLIAYVYLIASIFIIKDDLIKQKQELNEISKIEEDVIKKLEEERNFDTDETDIQQDSETPSDKDSQNKTEHNDEKEETEEKNIGKEPDGSEI